MIISPEALIMITIYPYRQMRSVSATEAKQRLAALLDAAQREPVVIRRQNRDVAVIMSAEEYARIRDLNAAELQRFCDRVADQARARGLDQADPERSPARLMRSRLRIVVDTNALVSRLLLPSSVPGQAVRKAVDDSILLVSEPR